MFEEERRAFVRAEVKTRGLICNLDAESMPINPKECTVLDLSEGGAKVQVNGRYRRYQPVLFTMRAYKEAPIHTILCTIAWAKYSSLESGIYGLKFRNLSEESTKKLQTEVSYLLAQSKTNT